MIRGLKHERRQQNVEHHAGEVAPGRQRHAVASPIQYQAREQSHQHKKYAVGQPH